MSEANGSTVDASEPSTAEPEESAEATGEVAAGVEAEAGTQDSIGLAHEKQQLDAETYTGEFIQVRPLGQLAPALTIPAATSEAPVLQRLAEANDAARAHSLTELARLFPGFDVAIEAQTTDDRRFSLLNIGDVLFNELNALETVERILTQQHFVGNRLRFSNGTVGAGDPPRVIDRTMPNVRRPRVGSLVDALGSQWTTIINSVDTTDPVLASVVEHFERVYGCRVNTNVYVSWGEAKGFGPHWDEHDTVIVPAAGSKLWTVYEPTALSPRRPWVSADVSQRPVWEGRVEPGMCLVIPRGWGHEVGDSDDLAIHYTIGINRVTVQNVLERLTVDGGFMPLARADLAFNPADQVVSYDKSVHDEAVLSELVADLAAPDLIERSMSTYRARMPMRMFPRLFDMWSAAGTGDWQGATLRMPVPAGVQAVAALPEHVVVSFDNRWVRINRSALELVIALADAQTHAIDDLPLVNDSAEARNTACAELAKADLVDISYGILS